MVHLYPFVVILTTKHNLLYATSLIQQIYTTKHTIVVIIQYIHIIHNIHSTYKTFSIIIINLCFIIINFIFYLFFICSLSKSLSIFIVLFTLLNTTKSILNRISAKLGGHSSTGLNQLPKLT